MSLILVSNETSQENALLHYRTKGSKNGIRRYQYPDGSLTPEGRQHYGVGEPRKKSAEQAVAKDSDTGEKKAAEKGRIGQFIDKKKAKIEKRHEQNKPLSRSEQKAEDKKLEERVKGFITRISNHEKKPDMVEKPSAMSAIREARNMSDEELNKQLDRLRREKQYSELIRDRETREKGPIRAAAEKLVGDAVQDLAKKSLTAAVDTIISKGREKLTGTSFRLSDYKDVDIYSMDSAKVSAISKAFQEAANLSRNRYAIEHPSGNNNQDDSQGGNQKNKGQSGGNQSGNGQNNGNQNNGNQNSGNTVSKNQRKQMRAMANSGKSAAEIAAKFGVSESTVRQYAGEQLKTGQPKEDAPTEPSKSSRHSYSSDNVGRIMENASNVRSGKSAQDRSVTKAVDRSNRTIDRVVDRSAKVSQLQSGDRKRDRADDFWSGKGPMWEKVKPTSDRRKDDDDDFWSGKVSMWEDRERKRKRSRQ